jgi:hypothetical protein
VSKSRPRPPANRRGAARKWVALLLADPEPSDSRQFEALAPADAQPVALATRAAPVGASATASRRNTRRRLSRPATRAAIVACIREDELAHPEAWLDALTAVLHCLSQTAAWEDLRAPLAASLAAPTPRPRPPAPSPSPAAAMSARDRAWVVAVVKVDMEANPWRWVPGLEAVFRCWLAPIRN